MKVEDLLSIIAGQKGVVIIGKDNTPIAQADNIEGIPAYLYGVVVDQIRITEKNVAIYTNAINQLQCMEHVKAFINEVEEEVAEDRSIDSIKNLDLKLALCLKELARDCDNMTRAIDEGESWDKYL